MNTYSYTTGYTLALFMLGVCICGAFWLSGYSTAHGTKDDHAPTPRQVFVFKAFAWTTGLAAVALFTMLVVLLAPMFPET
jgi:hypothetical protein